MILQAIVSPIPAFALSIANGLTFWAWWGAVLSLFGRSRRRCAPLIARAPDYIWLLLINGAIFAAALAATYLLKRKA